MPAVLLGVQNFVSMCDTHILSSNQTHQRRHTDLKPLPTTAVQQVCEAIENEVRSKGCRKSEQKGHRDHGRGCSGRGPVASHVRGADLAYVRLDRVF
jgi:hypothetical protein